MKVPEGWKKVKINQICNHVTSGSRGWASYYTENSGDRFIRITNLRRDNIIPDYSKMKFIKLPKNFTEGTRTRLKENDILISITADLGIIGFIDSEPYVPSYINQHIALVRLDKGTSFPKFVAYLLASNPYQKYIKRLNDAGAKAGLNLSTIEDISFPLPPLSEQIKIADILSTWDKAIKAQEKLILNSEAVKKSLMQQLLTGKKRLKGFSGAWEEVRLGDVADITSGYAFKNNDFTDQGGVRIIKMSDLKNGNISKENFSMVKESSILYLNKFKLKDGDFLFGMSGSLSNYAWIKEKDLPIYLNQRVGKICAIKNNNSLFIQLLYLSSKVQNKILSSAAGAAQLNISSAFIRGIKIQIPPLPEQTAIASILSDADTEIERQKQKLEILKQEKSALMQQLLTGKKRVVV